MASWTASGCPTRIASSAIPGRLSTTRRGSGVSKADTVARAAAAPTG